jgi:hypothetical protein
VAESDHRGSMVPSERPEEAELLPYVADAVAVDEDLVHAYWATKESRCCLSGLHGKVR